MTEVRKKTNLVLRELIETLESTAKMYNARIWNVIAEELNKPSRRRRAVNISKINRYTNPGDVVVVPGKVLGAGNLEHPVTVAAFSFSKTALEKIRLAGGRAITIFELIRENPKGSNVKILG